MWVDYRGSLSAVYSDGEISTNEQMAKTLTIIQCEFVYSHTIDKFTVGPLSIRQTFTSVIHTNSTIQTII